MFIKTRIAYFQYIPCDGIDFQ